MKPAAFLAKIHFNLLVPFLLTFSKTIDCIYLKVSCLFAFSKSADNREWHIFEWSQQKLIWYLNMKGNGNLPFLSKKSQDWAVNWKFFWSLLFWPRKNNQPWYLNWRETMSSQSEVFSRTDRFKKMFPLFILKLVWSFSKFKKVYRNWCDLFQNPKKCTEKYVIFFKIQKSTQKLVWSF